ncbi:pectate lyase superfamily protein-domain-containing protein [Xylogone sp. PMI_703]|nr:pectate lyase superfamily protein-domain-containing protein [Xylogone sp. PMI_703]
MAPKKLMSMHITTLIFLIFLLSVNALFNGEKYTGSAAQIAELKKIADANRAKIAKIQVSHAAPNLTASITKHDNTPPAAIAEARAVVASAIAEMRATNKARVENPLRNTYVSRHSSSSKRRTAIPSPLTRPNTTVAAAAALVAEVDAAAKAKNGTLYRDYSSILALHRGHNSSAPVKRQTTSFWMEGVDHLGTQPLGGDSSYKVWRNVKDYGAAGDGVTDDTDAINRAISEGDRCGSNCESSSVKGALVYFPAGTYLVTSTIISMYNTQLVGNPNSVPTIKAAASFVGLGVISSDVYYDNGNGAEWYIEQSNFYRQVRNFIIDISDTDPNAYVAALHWQVAQATSLQNINFVSSEDSSTTQQGIYCENGSGGWMDDLVFYGGNFGIYGGEQQFTSNDLTFSGCNTAVQTIWDWGWTWKAVQVISCGVGFSLLGEDGVTRGTGSFLLQDAIIEQTPVGILMAPPLVGEATGTTNILLDNVAFDGVTTPIKDSSGNTILSGANPLVIDMWALGDEYYNAYTAANPDGSEMTFSGGSFLNSSRSPSLTIPTSHNAYASDWYFARSKPQYETYSASDFINMKNFAAGDGVTDDTEAFRGVLENTGILAGENAVVYIPAGTYILTDTIFIGADIRVVGECWAQLMASGSNFEDGFNPHVMVQVGSIGGQIASVEISDLLFTATGQLSGLVAMEWNMEADSQGSAAMWDSHFRIGGAIGTGLQLSNCPAGDNAACVGGALLLHLTTTASAYLENVWLWVADHDIDDANNARINVLVARGMLIESNKALWMYGTASEHAVLYQYEFSKASTVIAGMIQTESAYFQPGIAPPAPFGDYLGTFGGDPTWNVSSCGINAEGCDESWAVRILNSSDITINGAGLYSWFQSYNEDCVNTANCQRALVQIGDDTEDIHLRNLITIGSVYMIGATAGSLLGDVLAVDNLNAVAYPWWSVINVFEMPELTIFPPNRNFFGLGDSFAAGIGASCGDILEDDPSNGDCKKCMGAYPYQLWHDNRGLQDESTFRFYACSGAKTGGVVSPPDPGKNSQVEQIQALPEGSLDEVGFSTLSIGGNNVGFSRVLKSCIFFDLSDCGSERERTETRIASDELQTNLTNSYRQILNLMPVNNFKLYVTGYAQFFNATDPRCNDKHIVPIAIWPTLPRAELAQELRAWVNEDVLALNAAIQRAINTVNQELANSGSQKFVRYVDIDSQYDTHRFCDNWPNWKSDAWFFAPAGGDTTETGGTTTDFNVPPSNVTVDLTKIDPNTCTDAADNSGDWGEMFMCGFAQAYALDPGAYDTSEVVTSNNDDGDDGIWSTFEWAAFLPTWIEKAFHPKTIALGSEAYKIWLFWYVRY